MKALRALKIVLKDTILTSQRAYLEEAIAELEELIKPKSCEGCKYFNKSINGGLCFRLDITVSTTFYCQGYEPKEIL